MRWYGPVFRSQMLEAGVRAAIAGKKKMTLEQLVTAMDEPATEDVRVCYDLHANGYITKPRQFAQFSRMMKALAEFWFATVTRPPGE